MCHLNITWIVPEFCKTMQKFLIEIVRTASVQLLFWMLYLFVHKSFINTLQQLFTQRISDVDKDISNLCKEQYSKFATLQ